MTYRFAAVKRGKHIQLVDADQKVFFKQVDGTLERQLQSIALHEVDLQSCKACLNELRTLNFETQTDQAEAYWIACITRFFKCFGESKSRLKLTAKKIFVASSTDSTLAFYLALRNKHIVHDENAFSNAQVFVAVSADQADDSIRRVVASPIHLYLINQIEIDRLSSLVYTASDWVTSKRVELERLLENKYKQWTRPRLLALPDLTVPSIEMDEVFTVRERQG